MTATGSASTAGLLDVVLAGAVLVVAVLAVVLPRRTAAVAVFLVFGVLLAVLHARLDAPDVALAEAALGGGVAGALLVDALAARTPSPQRRRTSWAVLVAGTAAGAVVLVALVAVVGSLPTAPGDLPARVTQSMDRSGVDHEVTAVLLAFRSYDTLLEIAVLVVAVLAADAVARRHPVAPAEPAGPVLRGLAAVLVPVLVLLAAWLLLAGTSRPGGAFQAGAVLGAGLVLAHLADVRRATVTGAAGRAAVLAGLGCFLALAALTAVVGGGWLVLDPGWAGPVVVTLEAVLAVGIGAGLARIFLANRADERPAAPAAVR